ncbi:MAG: hypothetical protein M1818_001578 [Claussenomyces sp. TS43310]|nr:MAG: hypothetical protein M1818_001578 [Claussenomyces sp. TS43310]
MAARATTPTTTLRHLHLPSPSTYHQASRIQSHLVSQFLAHKAALSSPTSTPADKSTAAAAPPPPTIITFSPTPIYTTGRRDLHTPITALQAALLTAPLRTRAQPPDGHQQQQQQQQQVEEEREERAEIHQSQRGGQITFHGPGQLVIYPILDLRRTSVSTAAPSPSSSSLSSSTCSAAPSPTLSPRCYVSLLESVTIRTLAHYGIRGTRTADPGVWVSADVKIAALGVHLRRFVSSHGVGLNVSTDLRWFDRIVACGLEGKHVTSMVRQRPELIALGVDEVARTWVREFASAIGSEGGVVEINERDVMGS